MIGLLQVILLITCMAYWGWFAITLVNSRSKKLLISVLTILFMSSPPITLLMERGNVDILIFAGITFSFLLLKSGRSFLGTALLILLGALKLYPMAGIVAISLQKESLARKITIGALLCLALFSLRSELQLISERSETAWNQVSYGISLIPLGIYQKLNISESKIVALVSGWALFVLTCAILFIACKVRFLNISLVLAQNHEVKLLMKLLLPIILFSYLVGTSFDYRMVLLFPVLSTCISLVQNNLVGWILLIAAFFLYGGHFAFNFSSIGLGLNIVSDLIMIPVFSFFFVLLLHLLLKNKS
jgi:hypothetical protein